MRIFRFLNLVMLSALLGSTLLVYAQDDKQQEDHPARQEDAKPQPKQDEAKPARPEESAPPKPEARPDNRPAQDQSHEQAMPNRQEHPEQPAEHAREGQDRPEQPMRNAHPAGQRGGHIPDEQFHAHFGQGHHFRARGVIVAGQPRFQYSGYTFELVDPWPAGWAYTDDCYIDYIDGEYFLFDVLHPGVRIALFVVM